MCKNFSLLVLFVFLSVSPLKAKNSVMGKGTVQLLNLNIFDQQQGHWDKGFRKSRLEALSKEIERHYKSLDFVFLQESRAEVKNDGFVSVDATYFKDIFPYDYYTHESTEKDGFSYGYLILSKTRPQKVWNDSFHFPGGSQRTMQFSLWKFQESSCLGVANLHLSWQGSKIRVQEMKWILSKMGQLKEHCPHWVFVGDYNADEKSEEINLLFKNGFQNLFSEPYQPTVGPYNPIRLIYGKIKNQTIDWALGVNIEGSAKVLFDKPTDEGVWISDHAAVLVNIKL